MKTCIKLELAVLVLLAPLSLSAWTGPTSAPPNSNVSAPVNLGSSDQVKNAGLSLNSLAVFGNTILSGTTNYLNFGTTAGITGYGIRNNSGILELKHNGDTWLRLGGVAAGTTDYVTKYTSSAGIGASIIVDTGTNVGVGTTSPAQKLSVAGRIYSASDGFQFPDGTVQTTAATGGSTTFQQFNSSGTWAKPSSGTMAFIECWGGGGGGGRNVTYYGGSGGGGGAYVHRMMPLASLPATVVVTIGAGGAAGASGGTAGSGGNSTFGSYLTAYGGAGGAGSSIYTDGGGGGGPLSGGSGSAPGLPSFVAVAQVLSYPGGSDTYAGLSAFQGSGCFFYNNNSSSLPAPATASHGGGGGCGGYYAYSSSARIGASSFSGGGGGGGTNASVGGAGGNSLLGGNGGAGGATGTAGSQPGGGGGAGYTGVAGAGGAGRCNVTVF